MTEKYQGIIIAQSIESSVADTQFYGPSQKPEVMRCLAKGIMPDGREVAGGIWLNESVDRRGIESIHLELLKKESVPERIVH